MDQGLKMLPLLAVLLITLRCAFGFPGGVYSKTNLRWGQASHSAFAPRAVQSSQSEYPVTGSLSVDEVGSSLIIDRSQKSTARFPNPRWYVKGGFSSSLETSRTQTGLVSAALAVPEDELQKSSLTSLQPQVSSSSSIQNIASQLARGQSLQNQYSSSSQGGSGLQSAGGLIQIVSHQREGISSGLLSSPDVPSLHTPESNVKLSSSPVMVSSQATTAQSSPILNMSSTLESSGPLLGVLGSGSSSYGAPGASTELLSSPSEVYYQPAGDKESLSIHASGSESSFPLQSSGAAVHVYSSESLSSSPSIETHGSTFTSLGSPITAQVISSRPVIVSSGSIGSSSKSIASQYSPGTLPPGKLGSLSMGVSSQSTKAQCLYMSASPSGSAMPLHPVQTGSSFRDLSSSKPQGISAVYAPTFPSKYLNVAASSPQSASFQSGSDLNFHWAVTQDGTQAGESKQFVSSQGGSSSYNGALSQPQSSPYTFSSGALKHTSPQTFSRPFTSEVNLHGSSVASFGVTSQSASKGMNSSFSGSMQSLSSSGQNVPSSPTFSKLSSSRQVYSQSRSDPGLYPQLSATSEFGSHAQKGSSPQLSQAASGFNSGSLPQFQESSPSKYVNVPIASQAFATQSDTASSRRGLTSTFLGGSHSGSSLTLQGTGSSSMPQRTMSQFVSESPSQNSSAYLSTTQSVAGQYSPAFQRVFSVSQRPQRLEPSASSWTQDIQSSGAALSQGNLQSPSSQVHGRFSSPLSAEDSAYKSNPQTPFGGAGQLVSSPGGSGNYSGISLQSPITSSRYPLGSSQSATGQSSRIYGSALQTGSGAQLSSSSYASMQGGSSSAVGSSQHRSVFSPLVAKAALNLSRPSAASLTQCIQTSKSASSRSTSSAQMSSGFSSSLSALSQNVVQSGLMSTVRSSQSLLGGVQRLSIPSISGSAISGQMSERFTSHHAPDSSLSPSSGMRAQLSSTGVFSGSSLPKTVQTLSEFWSQSKPRGHRISG